MKLRRLVAPLGTTVIFSLISLVSTAALAATTERVSVDSNGVPGNNMSRSPAISSDGRYVAFESDASNLVPGDTNGLTDIFVHDRQTGQTTRVSVDSNGVEGNDQSNGPALSADGRYVAFESRASNLVPGDTTDGFDVFVHDRQTGQTTRVSVDSNGVQGDNGSGGPAISLDGRYVAFASLASNFAPGDTNGLTDIFVHDRQTGQTTRVSVDSNGVEGNDQSNGPALSADGRYVAFESDASNLVPGDTNGSTDVFVHDLQTGQTTRVSVDSNGVQGDNRSERPAISLDGRYVAFASRARNLVPGDINSGFNVFVHDRQTGQTRLVSVALIEDQLNFGDSISPSISGDERYVVFQSFATNLVPGDTNGAEDVFVAIMDNLPLLDYFGMDVGNSQSVRGTYQGVLYNDQLKVVSLDYTTFPVTTYVQETWENGSFYSREWYEKNPGELKGWGFYDPEFGDFYKFSNGLLLAWNPMNVGEHKSTSGTLSVSDVTLNQSLTVDVLSKELVSISLGTFEAYKLKYQMHIWNPEYDVDETDIYFEWFVPYLGTVRAEGTDYSDELTSFAIGGGTINRMPIPVGGDLGVDSFTAPAPIPLTLQLNVTDKGVNPPQGVVQEWLVFGAIVGGKQTDYFFFDKSGKVTALSQVTDPSTVTFTFNHASSVQTLTNDFALGTLGLGAGDMFFYLYAWSPTLVSSFSNAPNLKFDNVVVLTAY